MSPKDFLLSLRLHDLLEECHWRAKQFPRDNWDNLHHQLLYAMELMVSALIHLPLPEDDDDGVCDEAVPEAQIFSSCTPEGSVERDGGICRDAFGRRSQLVLPVGRRGK